MHQQQRDPLKNIRYDSAVGLISMVDITAAITGRSHPNTTTTLREIRIRNHWYASAVTKHSFPNGSKRWTPAGDFELCQLLVSHILTKTTYVSDSDKKEWRRRFCLPEPVLYSGFDPRTISGLEQIRYDEISGITSLIDITRIITGMTPGAAWVTLDKMNSKHNLNIKKHKFPGERQSLTFVARGSHLRLVVQQLIDQSYKLSMEEKNLWLSRFDLVTVLNTIFE